jgi:hypothetical protein
MTIQASHDYSLSTEELAMAFSMINRPDMGKAALFETFGELSQTAIQERLKAASHSLLARKFASIGERGMAVISNELQGALAALILFDGMIQVVVHETQPVITNFHLGLGGQFTSHWVEQGVVHHMIQASLKNLPGFISQLASLPTKISTKLESQILEDSYKISMESFANLTEMKFEAGLDVLVKAGLDLHLAKILLGDLFEPMKRGSVSYIPVDAKHLEQGHLEKGVPGLFFVIGKSSWILAFSGIGKEQIGSLIPGTSKVFEDCINEFVEKKSNAFAG